MAASASRATFIPLKDYLKKYDDREEQGEKKKKKKKKSKTSNDASKLLVVDEDPIWQKQLKEEEDDDNISEEEKPQINEDIEVKRLKRLEELRAKRPYHVLSEDGSGWVSISGSPKSTNFSNSPPDWSPPRPNCTLSDQPLPKLPEKKKSGQPNGPNLSLPQRLHHDEPDISNFSPRRRRVQRNSDDPGIPDLSPPRRRARHDSEESDIPDLSPPPKQVHHHSNEPNILDLDPPRKRIHHNLEKPNIPDLSPPRRRGFLRDSEEPIKRDLSLSRRQVRHNSEEPCIPDLSPPRRWDRHNPNESKILDVSPSRRLLRRDPSEPIIQDLSPSRRLRRNSLDSDPSLARIPTDLTPSRISRKNSSFGPKSKDKKAGLISGQEIKKENERKRKEGCSRLSEMDPSVIGQGAEPVYRDKEGKRVSRDEYLKLQQGEEKPKEKKLEWGKGLAQKREAEARELELELEKDKPFARSRDDPDLDKMLKERIRWGDPMAHLVKHKQPELVLEDLGDNVKMTESGFIIPQTIPSHSWLKRGIDLPANRYGIRPGRHWDGVDRSNGFEKEMFNKQNEKRAIEQEAYLWSVSDM